jgi:HEAT repeat protein
VKAALLRVLGVVGGAPALSAVKSALQDAEAAVRDTAVRVLADWPEAPALPALLEVLRSTQNESHRFLALRGCVRLLADSAQPAAHTLDTFRELLARTDRSDDRKVILSGLAKLHEPAALALVEPLLNDDLGHGLSHSRRVSLDCATLIAIEANGSATAPAERERWMVLGHLAGLMHDICREQPRHAIVGAREAAKILDDFPVSREEIRWICRAIENHEAFVPPLPCPHPNSARDV